jgi:hypothetical protein
VFVDIGSGRFRDATEEIGGALLIERSSRGAAFGDLDNDGDTDVLVTNMNERPTLLRNDTDAGNNWIVLKLAGRPPNRDAIGARVWLEDSGSLQMGEVRSGGSYLFAQRHASTIRPRAADDCAPGEGPVARRDGRTIRKSGSECDSRDQPTEPMSCTVLPVTIDNRSR